MSAPWTWDDWAAATRKVAEETQTPFAMVFDLESTTRTLLLRARTLLLRARKSGAFTLPEAGTRIILPPGQRRRLRYVRNFRRE